MLILLPLLIACTSTPPKDSVLSSEDTASQDTGPEETPSLGQITTETLPEFGEVGSAVWVVDQNSQQIQLSNQPDMAEKIAAFESAFVGMMSAYSENPEIGCADLVASANQILETSKELYFDGANYMMFVPDAATLDRNHYEADNDMIVQIQFYTGNPWDIYANWDPNSTMAQSCGLSTDPQPASMEFYELSTGSLDFSGRTEANLTGSFEGKDPETGVVTAEFVATLLDLTQ